MEQKLLLKCKAITLFAAAVLILAGCENVFNSKNPHSKPDFNDPEELLNFAKQEVGDSVEAVVYDFFDVDSVRKVAVGIEVLNDVILAVGFDHGLSILNYTDLDSIYEVAYYRDPDSLFRFTHYALKENRLYAMAHPEDRICRMYMFELDEGVISGQGESSIPENFQFYNFPNPFNSECQMVINADRDYRNSELEVFDINGRKVYTESISLKMGINRFVWTPQGNSSGLYFARIIAGKYSQIKKLVYLQ